MALIHHHLGVQAQEPFIAIPPMALWQLQHPHCAFVFRSSGDRTDTTLYTPEGSLKRTDTPTQHDAFVKTEKQWERLRSFLKDLSLEALPLPEGVGPFCVLLDAPPEVLLAQWLSPAFLEQKPNAGKRTLQRLTALYEARMALIAEAGPQYVLLPEGAEAEAAAYLPKALPGSVTVLSRVPIDHPRVTPILAPEDPLPEGDDPLWIRYDPEHIPDATERTICLIEIE